MLKRTSNKLNVHDVDAGLELMQEGHSQVRPIALHEHLPSWLVRDMRRVQAKIDSPTQSAQLAVPSSIATPPLSLSDEEQLGWLDGIASGMGAPLDETPTMSWGEDTQTASGNAPSAKGGGTPSTSTENRRPNVRPFLEGSSLTEPTIVSTSPLQRLQSEAWSRELVEKDASKQRASKQTPVVPPLPVDEPTPSVIEAFIQAEEALLGEPEKESKEDLPLSEPTKIGLTPALKKAREEVKAELRQKEEEPTNLSEPSAEIDQERHALDAFLEELKPTTENRATDTDTPVGEQPSEFGYSIPDDPDEAIAWLEAMAKQQKPSKLPHEPKKQKSAEPKVTPPPPLDPLDDEDPVLKTQGMSASEIRNALQRATEAQEPTIMANRPFVPPSILENEVTPAPQEVKKEARAKMERVEASAETKAKPTPTPSPKTEPLDPFTRAESEPVSAQELHEALAWLEGVVGNQEAFDETTVELDERVVESLLAEIRQRSSKQHISSRLTPTQQEPLKEPEVRKEEKALNVATDAISTSAEEDEELLLIEQDESGIVERIDDTPIVETSLPPIPMPAAPNRSGNPLLGSGSPYLEEGDDFDEALAWLESLSVDDSVVLNDQPTDASSSDAETELTVNKNLYPRERLRARDALSRGKISEVVSEYETILASAENEGVEVVINDMNKMILRAPGQPAFYRVLGDALILQDQFQRALDTYREGLLVYERNPLV